jgi:hypothetical protein
MPADARLALAEDPRQVLHIELALGQQHQHAQARRFGDRLENADRGRKAQHWINRQIITRHGQTI